jgi:hypothetical protein
MLVKSYMLQTVREYIALQQYSSAKLIILKLDQYNVFVQIFDMIKNFNEGYT